jgi:hypothetical protein
MHCIGKRLKPGNEKMTRSPRRYAPRDDGQSAFQIIYVLAILSIVKYPLSVIPAEAGMTGGNSLAPLQFVYPTLSPVPGCEYCGSGPSKV